jgi:hypothetical protein
MWRQTQVAKGVLTGPDDSAVSLINVSSHPHLDRAPIVEAVVNETREVGWDGGDAAPVREETIAKVWALLAALPPQVPMPEISAEPDGDVALDWIMDRERQVSVSVRHNGESHFSGLFGGGRKVHGADVFSCAVPPMVLSAIKQVVG